MPDLSLLTNMESFSLYAAWLSIMLFTGMLFLVEVGRRIGARRLAQDPDGGLKGLGGIEGAILALLGLLLAFTVTGAASRFDARRNLIVEEANAVGTAYLRLDVLSPTVQSALREKFRRYVDIRLDAYRKMPDVVAVQDALEIANQLQRDIWRGAVAGLEAKGSVTNAAVIILPALNAIIDITTTRTRALQMHPPLIVFVMLFVFALFSALLSGYAMAGSKTRSWLHMICFGLIISVTVFVILDLEYPRAGLIRVDAFDQTLIELRNSMN